MIYASVGIMNGSRGDSGDRDLAQDPVEPAASHDASWGRGSASALESLKKREQQREHAIPRREDDTRPQAP